MRKLILIAAVAAALIYAPAALAASSPTVSTSAPTGIGQTAATLHGTVKPNGLATTYQFEYGTTTALGSKSPATAASAGSGTVALAELAKLSGLSPDTTYYYELTANNSAGQSSTPPKTFKTTGNPAPGATTEPADNVGRYTATLVGVISPNNQATSYYFQYGLTTAYGYQTVVKSIPAGSTPVTVSTALPGIEPGTVFHYRLIASHGPTATTTSADVTFETLPWPRPHTRLSFAVSPRSAKKGSTTFVAHGHIGLAYTTSAALGCHGTVTINYYQGSTKMASARAAVNASCAYRASTRLRGLGNSRTRITVKLRFNGDAYAAPSSTRTTFVTVR
jgi:hypothetical protein